MRQRVLLTSSSSFSTTARYFWMRATLFSLPLMVSLLSTDWRMRQEARRAPTCHELRQIVMRGCQ